MTVRFNFIEEVSFSCWLFFFYLALDDVSLQVVVQAKETKDGWSHLMDLNL